MYNNINKKKSKQARNKYLNVVYKQYEWIKETKKKNTDTHIKREQTAIYSPALFTVFMTLYCIVLYCVVIFLLYLSWCKVSFHSNIVWVFARFFSHKLCPTSHYAFFLLFFSFSSFFFKFCSWHKARSNECSFSNLKIEKCNEKAFKFRKWFLGRTLKAFHFQLNAFFNLTCTCFKSDMHPFSMYEIYKKLSTTATMQRENPSISKTIPPQKSSTGSLKLRLSIRCRYSCIRLHFTPQINSSRYFFYYDWIIWFLCFQEMMRLCVFKITYFIVAHHTNQHNFQWIS